MKPSNSPAASSRSIFPVAFGGGEPLAPHCWDVFEILAGSGVALKLETDGHR
jgi:hypothetical protein